ncbi:MAG: nuclear transport factor 2 family protein [Sphingomonadales bacterium]
MRLWVILFGLAFLVAACGAADANQDQKPEIIAALDAEKQAVARTLDRFHDAAAKADGETYFALFAEDGVFIGTDAGERWSVSEFKAYAEPHFFKGHGWTYVPAERHIDLAPGENVAWFDEILMNEKYGTSRGTGVLVRSKEGWKIAQYHLTFPIPNALGAEITAKIKAFEASRTK